MKVKLDYTVGYITLRNKSLLLKSIICGLVFWIFTLLIIFVEYIIHFSVLIFVLGILYGVVIAVVSYCDKVKRTIVAMLMGILAAVVSQFILLISGVPYKIIFYIFRNNTWVKQSGRLSVNEVIGYNWGIFSFWYGLLISFVILIICISLYNTIKSLRKQA